MLLVHITAREHDALYRARAHAICQAFYQAPIEDHDYNHDDDDDDDDDLSPLSVIPESPPVPPQTRPEKATRSLPPSNTTLPAVSAPVSRPDPPPATISSGCIYAPRPPVAAHRFTTHVTPSLALLAARLPLRRVYVPVHQARELGVLERGFWAVPLSVRHPGPGPAAGFGDDGVWESALFNRFWTFLQDFLQEGRAGWGVWCVLEQQQQQQQQQRDLLLKVYSWGELVPYIYLLLFVASERHIRALSIQWRDALEKVVVQM